MDSDDIGIRDADKVRLQKRVAEYVAGGTNKRKTLTAAEAVTTPLTFNLNAASNPAPRRLDTAPRRLILAKSRCKTCHRPRESVSPLHWVD